MSGIPSLSFTVPGTPVPKARPRIISRAGQRRAITPAKTKAYEDVVGWHGLQARQAACARMARWPLEALYAVEIEVSRRDGKGDVDNFAKAVLDGLNGILWDDDDRVIELHVRRVEGTHDGLRVHVETRAGLSRAGVMNADRGDIRIAAREGDT